MQAACLALGEQLNRIDFQCICYAFQKIQRGGKFCILDLTEIAAAYVGTMCKFLLTEITRAPQILNV